MFRRHRAALVIEMPRKAVIRIHIIQRYFYYVYTVDYEVNLNDIVECYRNFFLPKTFICTVWCPLQGRAQDTYTGSEPKYFFRWTAGGQRDRRVIIQPWSSYT